MPGGRVAFRTLYDTFLCAMDGMEGKVVHFSKPQGPDEWEKFQVIPVRRDHGPSDRVALRTHHGTFLCATDQSSMTQQQWMLSWETFDAPWLLQACLAQGALTFCTSCLGVGRVICARCGGAGSTSTVWQQCDVCEGKGRILCKSCDATGFQGP
jgi:hypothetical protein